MMKRLFAILMCLVLLVGAALPASAARRHRRHARHYASRTYYTYSTAPRRTFWQKHRDKLTVAGGTLGGALIGGSPSPRSIHLLSSGCGTPMRRQSARKASSSGLSVMVLPM